MTTLFDAMVRHQIYVEGLKRGRGDTLALRLLQLNTDIKSELAQVSYANLGDLTKTKLGELLLRLKKLAETTFNAWLNDLIEWLQRYMVIDRDLLPRIFAATSDREEAAFEKAPDGEAIFGLAKNSALAANGLLMLPFLKGYATQAPARIVAIVTMAHANRQSPAEALAALVGPPVADRNPAPGSAPPSGPSSPKGGVLALLDRQGRAVTNTVIQHAAAQSNFAVAKAAFDQYLWISVLDDGTTVICRDRNGNVFVYGKGPMPPAHIGCRSSTMPFDGTGPVTMPSFTVWAKGQPEVFRNDAFDGEIGSTYEGSSPLSLEQFRGKFGLITTG